MQLYWNNADASTLLHLTLFFYFIEETQFSFSRKPVQWPLLWTVVGIFRDEFDVTHNHAVFTDWIFYLKLSIDRYIIIS